MRCEAGAKIQRLRGVDGRVAPAYSFTRVRRRGEYPRAGSGEITAERRSSFILADQLGATFLRQVMCGLSCERAAIAPVRSRALRANSASCLRSTFR